MFHFEQLHFLLVLLYRRLRVCGWSGVLEIVAEIIEAQVGARGQCIVAENWWR
jgi:1-acyl-sn-glycerol-3-phosphate acyltransferase